MTSEKKKGTKEETITLRREDVRDLAYRIMRCSASYLWNDATADRIERVILDAAVEVPECIPSFRCGLNALERGELCAPDVPSEAQETIGEPSAIPEGWARGGAGAVLVGRDGVPCPTRGKVLCTNTDPDHLHTFMSRAASEAFIPADAPVCLPVKSVGELLAAGTNLCIVQMGVSVGGAMSYPVCGKPKSDPVHDWPPRNQPPGPPQPPSHYRHTFRGRFFARPGASSTDTAPPFDLEALAEEIITEFRHEMLRYRMMVDVKKQLFRILQRATGRT